MPIDFIDVAASPDAVFAVLADPESYGHWVVGAADIRDADPGWPAAGTRFHHTQGVKGVGLKDTTSVVSVEPGRRLVLEVRARPVVVAEVDLQIAAQAAGTRVTMTEKATGGVLARIYNPAIDRAISARNRVSLGRLKRLAEERQG